MQYEADHEPVAKLISQPDEVSGGVDPRCRGGFELHRHGPMGVELGDEVDLVVAVLIA